VKSLPHRRIGLALVVLSIALIGAIIVPWDDLQDHSHWSNIGWIPFVSPPIRRRDILANVVLFAPLGVGATLRFRRGVAVAAGLGLILSLTGETIQVYTHSRFPSATDLVCNVGGAVAGALVVRWLVERPKDGR
jgi:glycopeptide antibiotics resistance protein